VLIFCVLCCVSMFIGCTDSTDNSSIPISYPQKAEVNNNLVLSTTPNGTKVMNGGYSGLTSNAEGIYYVVTDRGPNIEGNLQYSKVFSNPGYNPHIDKFKLVGDSLVLQSTISFKEENGKAFTGLPNKAGEGSTGEIAIDVTGNILAHDVSGIDPEGLVIANDGTFWVSDEYGPNIFHFDQTGKLIERINSFGNGGKQIPAVFIKRRPNKSMEGIAITPDQKYLVGIMECPLYNPDSQVKNTALAVRILFYEIATGTAKEYLYILDNVIYSTSDIVAITNSTFLVIERDSTTPGKDATNFKKVFKIDIAKASNISEPGAGGKLINGKTIEQSTPDEIKSAGIIAVSKEEIVDIMSIPNYPHDKPAGIVIINNNMIGIINDNDFGVIGTGVYEKKSMPLLSNNADKNVIYFVPTLKSLK
jgi:hypothetical protein